MELTKIPFEDGQLISDGYVEINGVKHKVVESQYGGKTPLSAYNLNKMQDNIGTAISDLDERVVPYRNVLVDEQALIKECAGSKLKALNKLVGREVEQEAREGYNLLAVDEEHCIQSSVSASTITYLEDGWVQIKNNTEAVTYINYASPSENIVAGKSYTLKVEFDDSNKCNIFLQNSSSDYSKVMGTTGNVTNVATTNYMNALISLTASMTIKVRLTLVEGTIAKDWEAYGKAPTPDFPSEVKTVTGNVEVKVGNKNLYNARDVFQVSDGASVDENDYITATWDNTNETSVKYLNYYTNFNNSIIAGKNYLLILEIKEITGEGTIIPSSSQTGTSKGQFETGYSEIFSGLKSNSIYVKQIKARDDLSDIKVMLRSVVVFQEGKSGSVTFRLSVLEDTSVTANTFKYMSHQSQVKTLSLGDIELCKTGDYADYIYRNGSKWFKRSYIGKVVFNGTENWDKVWNDSTAPRYGWRTSILNALFPKSSAEYLEVISTHFKPYIQNELYKGSAYAGYTESGICIRANNSQVIIKNNNITSVADFKSWLAEQHKNGTPVVVYYILETPTDTEILNARLIAQLGALEKTVQLYEGITNITITGDNLTPILDIDYWTWFKGETGDVSDLQRQIDELRSIIENLNN